MTRSFNLRIGLATAGAVLLLLCDRAFADASDGSASSGPGLPRVLIIGDSISMGYTPPLKKLLEGRAEVVHIGENGGATTNGLARLDAWLAGGKWDVIHFNWGLHDIKLLKDRARHVGPEDYEANLRKLVARLKATGAELVWATSTPVPSDEARLVVKRAAEDVPIYNAIALRVMSENQVAIDDLHGFALPRVASIQYPFDVHYKPEGYSELAGQVAKSVEQALERRRKAHPAG